MKIIAMCAAVAAMLLMTATEGEADCCYADFKFKLGEGNDVLSPTIYVVGCRDCTSPTPYCGYGKCNIFGCNCDGGCRSGGCRNAAYAASVDLAPTITITGADVLEAAGADPNGKLSIADAVVYLTAKGIDVSVAAVQALDGNRDGFITIDEIDN